VREVGLVHFHCVLEIRIESSLLSTCRKRIRNVVCVLGDFASDGGGLSRICLSCSQLVREISL
jgi:hypothetical protein